MAQLTWRAEIHMMMHLCRSALRATALVLCMASLTASASTEVRVGVHHNPPKLMLDANGWPSGILGDLLQEMARQNEWTLVSVPCYWEQCLESLQAGRIDLVPDVAFTDERAQRFQFHQQPVLRSWSQLYRRADIPLRSITDLAGRRVAVLANSTQQFDLQQMLAELDISAELVPVRGYDEAFEMARRGTVDAVNTNRHYGELHAAAAELEPMPFVFEPSRLFFAASPQVDPALLAQIDATLAQWAEQPDSYYHSVLQAWSPLAKPAGAPRWLWPLLGVLALAVLVVLVMSFWLRRQIHKRRSELRRLSAEIAEQERVVRDMQPLAQHDPLTLLPNRLQFEERLRHCLESFGSQPVSGTLLLINLDNMAILNEQLGYACGDLRLQQVAQRLVGGVAHNQFVARVGGEQFAVLIPDLGVAPQDAAARASSLARGVLRNLSQPHDLNGHPWQGTVSIGIVLLADAQNSVDTILRHADFALLQAKAAGGDTFRLFHPEVSAMLSARNALDTELRQAIEHEQFVLHYQPQVDVNGELTGYEAMVRWQHPSRGLLLPVHFIPFAEASEHIIALNDWVLRTACAQLARWGQSVEHSHLTLAVNIGTPELLRPDGAQQILQCMADAGANPSRLELELNETDIIDDIDATVARLRELRTAGVRITLDDFGADYSSLNYVTQLPIDRLKIDMSLVRDLLHDANDVAIVSTIISLAHSLDLEVIAEGVESQAQRDILYELGCRHFQGYWFGRPEPWPNT